MTDPTSSPALDAAASKRRFKDSVKLLSEHSLPLEVGKIELDEEGFLRARTHQQPIHLTFEFRGFDFDVFVSTGNEARVELKSVLGKLPFTAESGLARTAVGRLISLAGSLSHGKLALSPEGEIVMHAESIPISPRTPVSIMASIAALLLEVRPHLDVIVEATQLAVQPATRTRKRTARG